MKKPSFGIWLSITAVFILNSAAALRLRRRRTHRSHHLISPPADGSTPMPPTNAPAPADRCPRDARWRKVAVWVDILMVVLGILQVVLSVRQDGLESGQVALDFLRVMLDVAIAVIARRI